MGSGGAAAGMVEAVAVQRDGASFWTEGLHVDKVCAGGVGE